MAGHAGHHQQQPGDTWPADPTIQQPATGLPPLVPHPPARPGWRCSTCDEPWPCEPARAALLIAYGGPGRQLLMAFLVEQLLLAEDDLARAGETLPATSLILWNRFVTWARRPPARR